MSKFTITLTPEQFALMQIAFEDAAKLHEKAAETFKMMQNGSELSEVIDERYKTAEGFYDLMNEIYINRKISL